MPLKFRQRASTIQLLVVCKNLHGLDRDGLLQQSRRLGGLDTNYHIILLNNGIEEYDRDIKAVGGFKIPQNEVSICVLVDAPNPNAINDAQKLTLQRLSIQYDLPIKYLDIEV